MYLLFIPISIFSIQIAAGFQIGIYKPGFDTPTVGQPFFHIHPDRNGEAVFEITPNERNGIFRVIRLHQRCVESRLAPQQLYIGCPGSMCARIGRDHPRTALRFKSAIPVKTIAVRSLAIHSVGLGPGKRRLIRCLRSLRQVWLIRPVRSFDLIGRQNGRFRPCRRLLRDIQPRRNHCPMKGILRTLSRLNRGNAPHRAEQFFESGIVQRFRVGNHIRFHSLFQGRQRTAFRYRALLQRSNHLPAVPAELIDAESD